MNANTTTTPATMEITFKKTICYKKTLTYKEFCEDHEGMPEEDLKRTWEILCEKAEDGEYESSGEEEDKDGAWTEWEHHVEKAWEEEEEEEECEDCECGECEDCRIIKKIKEMGREFFVKLVDRMEELMDKHQ